MDPVFGFPSLVRFSWKTSYNMMEKENQKFEWFDTVGTPGQNEMSFNKTEFNKQEAKRVEAEQKERARLKGKESEKERRMNIVLHRLKINRDFD